MSFAELAASMRRDVLAARAAQAPLPMPPPSPEVTAALVLLEAAALLRSGADPEVAAHPNRAVKAALRRRGIVHSEDRRGDVGRAAYAAVMREMRGRHPDWPQNRCLERLAAEEGPQALRSLLLKASARCAPPYQPSTAATTDG